MHIARAHPPAQHIDKSAVYPGRHVVITGQQVIEIGLGDNYQAGRRLDLQRRRSRHAGYKAHLSHYVDGLDLAQRNFPGPNFQRPRNQNKKSGRFVSLVTQHPSRLEFDEIAHIYYGLHLVVGQSVDERYFIPHFANILDPDLHTHSPSLGQAPGPSGLFCYSPRMPTARSNRIKASARSRRAVAFSVCDCISANWASSISNWVPTPRP